MLCELSNDNSNYISRTIWILRDKKTEKQSLQSKVVFKRILSKRHNFLILSLLAAAFVNR